MGITKKIKKSLAKAVVVESPRPYLGMSIIGEPCARKLWYKFRWMEHRELSPRMNRLFARGHAEEDRLIATFRNAGFSVSGQQKEFSDLSGFFKGHCDGVFEKKWILEIKTHSRRYFSKVLLGELKKHFPKHYAQCQAYMHYAKKKKALYCAICKDTDALHIEEVIYDATYADMLIGKATDVITAIRPLPMISSKIDYWQCRFCASFNVCKGGAMPPKHCRSCVHGEPHESGKWVCQKRKTKRSVKKQRKGCEEWQSALTA